MWFIRDQVDVTIFIVPFKGKFGVFYLGICTDTRTSNMTAYGLRVRQITVNIKSIVSP